MAAFIWVTSAISGEPVIINTDKIVYFDASGDGTLFRVANQDLIRCTESFSKVCSRLMRTDALIVPPLPQQ